jgi:hypothetical protein
MAAGTAAIGWKQTWLERADSLEPHSALPPTAWPDIRANPPMCSDFYTLSSVRDASPRTIKPKPLNSISMPKSVPKSTVETLAKLENR